VAVILASLALSAGGTVAPVGSASAAHGWGSLARLTVGNLEILPQRLHSRGPLRSGFLVGALFSGLPAPPPTRGAMCSNQPSSSESARATTRRCFKQTLEALRRQIVVVV